MLDGVGLQSESEMVPGCDGLLLAGRRKIAAVVMDVLG